MDTVFTNSWYCKTSDPHRLLLNLSIYYTWKYIKKSHINNKFQISAPT